MARELFDSVPCCIRANLAPDDAKRWVHALEQVGGMVEVAPHASVDPSSMPAPETARVAPAPFQVVSTRLRPGAQEPPRASRGTVDPSASEGQRVAGPTRATNASPARSANGPQARGSRVPEARSPMAQAGSQQSDGKRSLRTHPLILVGASIGSVAMGLAAGNSIMGGTDAQPSNLPEPDIFFAVVTALFSGFVLVSGLIFYAAAYATNGFTFGYERAVWPGLKRRLAVSNIIWLALMAIGSGGFGTAVGAPLLVRLGVPQQIALIVPFFAVVVAVNAASVFVSVWTPVVRKVATRRLEALGVTRTELARARLIGTSDPSRSSFKKMTRVEDDIGFLFMEPGKLVYRGDGTDWEVPREQVVAIERAVDIGSTAAYAGARHVLLRFRVGAEDHVVRLHTEDAWFLGQISKHLDALADGLAAWLEDANRA